MSNKTIKIDCPTCGKKDTWKADNDSKPFCSHRCKLVDLGEWADGQRSIPGDPLPPTDSENDEI